jgi:multidrug efflux pump subunit AcrA (membrane-fusion protein)
MQQRSKARHDIRLQGKKPEVMPPLARLRRWGLVLAILLVSAAIVVAVAAQFVPLTNESEEEPVVTRRRPEVLVSAARVRAMNLQETVGGVGTLEASAKVEISPEISGRIKAIRFEEGAFVEEDTVLFELDEDRLQHQRTARQAAVRAAEVAADNARSIFERRLQLRAREVLTEEAVEEAEANLNSALAEKDRLEAELALIERELQDTKSWPR